MDVSQGSEIWVTASLEFSIIVYIIEQVITSLARTVVNHIKDFINNFSPKSPIHKLPLN